MAQYTNEFGQHATVDKVGDDVVIRWDEDGDAFYTVYEKNGRYYKRHTYSDKHGIRQYNAYRINKKEFDFWAQICKGGNE